MNKRECVICGNVLARTGKPRKFGICVGCYKEIRNGIKVIPGTEEHHTKCIMCKVSIDHYHKHSLCNNSNCRSRFYAEIKIKETIDEAMLIGDSSSLGGYSVNRIKKFGYDIQIIKK